MLLTEQDAKRTWCCRHLEDTCIASVCMAWRWGEEENDLSYNSTGRLVDAGPRGANRKGFCGLAGLIQYT